jgi:hypothetical protein
MIAHNQQFHDIRISLDGATFVGCTFERCTLVFSGLLPPHLAGNGFHNCKWEFAGPAAQTLGFMTSLYSQGGEFSKLIEMTFANVRNNATGQRRAGDAVILN